MVKAHSVPVMCLASISMIGVCAAANEKVVVIRDCRIEPVNQVVLASDRAGTLSQFSLREGGTVQDGQIVATLNDGVAQTRLAVVKQEAENDVDVRFARKACQVAANEYEISLRLNERSAGVITIAELERLRLAAERAELQIESAERELAIKKLRRDEAEAELDTYRVKAPFEGTVTRVFKSRGQAVQQGDPILEVTNVEKLRIEGYVGRNVAANLNEGDSVSVRMASRPDAVATSGALLVLRGRLIFVDVTVEPVTQQVRVLAEVENSSRALLAGLSTELTVLSEERLAPDTRD